MRIFKEIHRRSLWQVLGIYLAGSYIALQVVNEVSDSVGLPDWVSGASIVLLVLGFPIVMATAFLQKGGPAKARSSLRPFASPSAEPFADAEAAGAGGGAAAPGDEQPAAAHGTPAAEAAPITTHHRLFTWRNAIAGGVLAFALLGVVAAGWFAMRTLGIGPGATLVAAGVLEERDRVLVAQFGSVSGDTVLAATASEALRVDLAQSQIVSVVEPQFVASALARMERPAGTRLDRQLAAELAVREGIKAVIAGELNSAGTGYVLTAEVVASATGETLVSQRVTARGDDDLLDAIDELSRRLREQIGESLRLTRSEPPLQRATTRSLEALRLFTQATRAIDIEDESERGIVLLEQAVAIDSTFGLAWRKLATEQMNNGRPVSVWGPSMTRAYELRDRLTDRERYLAIASYHGYLTDEPEQSLTAYEAMLDLDPNDYYALNNGALELMVLGEFARAEEWALRGLEVSPDTRFLYLTAMAAQVNQNKFAEARATFERLTASLPGIPAIDIWGSRLAFAEADYELARTHTRNDLERRRANPGARSYNSFILFRLDRMEGRLADAERRVADRVAAEIEFGGATPRLDGALLLAWVDDVTRGDPSAGVRRIEEALALEPLSETDPLDRPYFPLIETYARAGRIDRARAWLEEYREVTPPELIDEDGVRDSRGEIALAEGRHDDAIAEFLQAADGRCTRRCPELARAYDRAGETDSALAVMERYVTTPSFYDHGTDAAHRNPFYERLGQLYDERGDLENAAKYYAMFVELWAEADDELQPRVAAAQARLQEIVEARG